MGLGVWMGQGPEHVWEFCLGFRLFWLRLGFTVFSGAVSIFVFFVSSSSLLSQAFWTKLHLWPLGATVHLLSAFVQAVTNRKVMISVLSSFSVSSFACYWFLFLGKFWSSMFVHICVRYLKKREEEIIPLERRWGNGLEACLRWPEAETRW